MITRPYSGPDDPDLPSDVQDMPEDKREQWVNVFNSALARCQDEGLSEVADNPDEFESCEAFAFANAYGVVRTVDKEGSMRISPVAELYQRVKNIFREFIGTEIEERAAISVSKVYNSVWNALEEEDYWVMVNDLYVDGGQMFALFTSESKLYRCSVDVDEEGKVELGEWLEIDLSATRARTRVQIIRQTDGRVRWLSISNTAVLNRVSEIDSRALFDSFIAHAEDTGEYPYRTFYHQGKAMKMGEADYLARDGYCYITSGLYDEDNELAEAEIEAREREPEYWGESIGFEPTAEPAMLRVTEDIDIPVYNEGINIEISTVPEERAAAWFSYVLNKEVVRMKPDVKEALLRLTDGDETLVEEFEGKVDSTNREIEERELIAREGEEPEPEEVEEEAEEETEEESEEESETEERDIEVDLDEASLDAIAAHLLKSDMFTDLMTVATGTAEAVEVLGERLDGMDKDLGRSFSQIKKRLDSLELDEDEKRRIWERDLPSKTHLKVSYRPRSEHSKDEGEGERSLAEIAAESMAALES
jgi:hypothetical protein